MTVMQTRHNSVCVSCVLTAEKQDMIKHWQNHSNIIINTGSPIFYSPVMLSNLLRLSPSNNHLLGGDVLICYDKIVAKC